MISVLPLPVFFPRILKVGGLGFFEGPGPITLSAGSFSGVLGLDTVAVSDWAPPWTMIDQTVSARSTKEICYSFL